MFAALYDWLLLLHILAAMLWLGGIVVIGAFAFRILRTREPGATAAFLGNLRVIGPLVLAPAPVILLAMGIWMVAEQWEFDQTWVSLGFGLFLVGVPDRRRAPEPRRDRRREGVEGRRRRRGAAPPAALGVRYGRDPRPARRRDVGHGLQARPVNELLTASRYMVLATADADGVPWASPVWFATDDGRAFYWVSDPNARHSRNIAARPEIAIVIFDSTVTPGDAAAVYMEARAEQAGVDGLDVFNRGCDGAGHPAVGSRTGHRSRQAPPVPRRRGRADDARAGRRADPARLAPKSPSRRTPLRGRGR